MQSIFRILVTRCLVTCCNKNLVCTTISSCDPLTTRSCRLFPSFCRCIFSTVFAGPVSFRVHILAVSHSVCAGRTAMYTHNAGPYRVVDPFAARARSVSPHGRQSHGMVPLQSPRASVQYPGLVSPHNHHGPPSYHHHGSLTGHPPPQRLPCPSKPPRAFPRSAIACSRCVCKLCAPVLCIHVPTHRKLQSESYDQSTRGPFADLC